MSKLNKEAEKLKQEIEEKGGFDLIIERSSILCYDEEYFNRVGSPKHIVMGFKDVIDGLIELKRMIKIDEGLKGVRL